MTNSVIDATTHCCFFKFLASKTDVAAIIWPYLRFLYLLVSGEKKSDAVITDRIKEYIFHFFPSKTDAAVILYLFSYLALYTAAAAHQTTRASD